MQMSVISRRALFLVGLLAVANAALWQGVREELPLRRLRLNAVKAGVPTAPAFSGAGIVMVAETHSDVATAYQTLAFMRERGVSSPAELWMAGGAPTPAATAEFAAINVALKDLASVAHTDQLAFREGKRPQALTLAIAHSSFEQVLVLDVANAATNADELLAHPALASDGMVFWPARSKPSAANPIWDLVQAQPVDSFAQGVDQILVNKNKGWTALHVAAHLATPFFGLMLNGNVDTLRMAALATKSQFVMESSAPSVQRAPARALPASLVELLADEDCTVLTWAQIKQFANQRVLNIEQSFRGERNGTKKTFQFPKAQWKPACKLFAGGTSNCDGRTITTTHNLQVAFVNVTMGGKDARLRFYHRGIDGHDTFLNSSVIQVGEWDKNSYKCDAKGILYTSVEENDAAPQGSFLLVAAYDFGNKAAPTSANNIYVDIVWNAGSLARPSFWLVVALAFALAVAAVTRDPW